MPGMNRRALAVFALSVFAAPTLADVWQDSYDPATGRRYIPLELILGAEWDGRHVLRYPSGTFPAHAGGSTWRGPRNWTHPFTGQTLTVYDRWRGGSNPARQIFAVRAERVAIGRVADSRHGILACDREAKFPLGWWMHGETRTYESRCWYASGVRFKTETITIDRASFTCGRWQHCLRLRWVLRDAGNDTPIDNEMYTFAPGKGRVQ